MTLSYIHSAPSVNYGGEKVDIFFEEYSPDETQTVCFTLTASVGTWCHKNTERSHLLSSVISSHNYLYHLYHITMVIFSERVIFVVTVLLPKLFDIQHCLIALLHWPNRQKE